MTKLSNRVLQMEESVTLAASARAKALKAKGRDILSLTLGEPDFVTPKNIQDAAIASIMIQLQAEDLGLGSCWVQVRERFTATGMPSDEFVHGILDIPLQLQILSVIAIGHKGMERKPFNEEHLQWEKIHINKFGGK